MKQRILGLLFVATLLALPALAQQVYVDYDKAVDFSQYKTFAWKAPSEASLAEESPLMHERVENAIEASLRSGGLTENTQSPDLWVTYHTSSKEEVQFSTSHMGYDYGPGWGWDPYWDAKTNKAIFRGAAEAVVKGKPEKQAKQIEKAIEKIGKKFDSMYRKGK